MDTLIDALKKKSRRISPKVVLIGIIASALVIALGVGGFWYKGRRNVDSKGSQQLASFSSETTSSALRGDLSSASESNGADGKWLNDSNLGENTIREETITVYVSGHVNKPGIYSLSASSRISDAIEAAGGVTKNAELLAVNLAAHIIDGQQIYVPSTKEVAKVGFNPLSMAVTGVGSSGGATGENAASGSGIPVESNSSSRAISSSGVKNTPSTSARININTASLSELEQLPGVGPAIAQRILSDRASNGLFSSLEDIMRVSGIGEKKFEALKDSISVK